MVDRPYGARFPIHNLRTISDDPFWTLLYWSKHYAVVLDLGLTGRLVQYRGRRGPLLILTEPR